MPERLVRESLQATVGEELVVMNDRTGQASNLNPVAAKIYLACDGKTPQKRVVEELGPGGKSY